LTRKINIRRSAYAGVMPHAYHLGTWEAAIGGLQFQTSLRKKVRKTLPQKTSQGWVLVAHTCNPSYSGGSDQED
jgi:hypothetical protein